MRYLGTAFSIVVGACRLRVSIDLDDASEPPANDEATAPELRAPAWAAASTRASS